MPPFYWNDQVFFEEHVVSCFAGLPMDVLTLGCWVEFDQGEIVGLGHWSVWAVQVVLQ